MILEKTSHAMACASTFASTVTSARMVRSHQLRICASCVSSPYVLTETLCAHPAVDQVHADLAHKLKNINKFFDKLAANSPARPFRDQVRNLYTLYVYGAFGLGRTEEELRSYLEKGASVSTRHLKELSSN